MVGWVGLVVRVGGGWVCSGAVESGSVGHVVGWWCVGVGGCGVVRWVGVDGGWVMGVGG